MGRGNRYRKSNIQSTSNRPLLKSIPTKPTFLTIASRVKRDDERVVSDTDIHQKHAYIEKHNDGKLRGFRLSFESWKFYYSKYLIALKHQLDDHMDLELDMNKFSLFLYQNSSKNLI